MKSRIIHSSWLMMLILVFVLGCEKDEAVFITINKLNSTVELGQTIQLSAEVSGAGSNDIDHTISWSSNKQDLISIDETGLASGVELTPATESVIITASLANGNHATAIMRVVPPNPKPGKVFLTTDEYYLRAGGEDTTITAIVLPVEIMEVYDAEWSVDHPEILEIKSVKKETGKTMVVVSPKADGVAKLTVKMGDKKASCKVFVGALIDLSWTQGSVITFMQKTLFPNTEFDLEAFAKVEPDDDATLAAMEYSWTMEGSGAILKNITQDSENKRIQRATLVAGEIPAKLKVFLSAKDKKIEAEVVIRNRYPVESLELEPATVEISVNDNFIPSFSILPTKAQDDWIALVQWTSSDPTVATVDSDGNIKGVGPGSAEIMAQVNGQSAVLTVTVRPIVDYVLISSGETVLMEGDINTWEATIYPEVSQAHFAVSWSSSNPAVANVDSQTGEVTAVGAGQAQVTALAGDKQTSKTITIVASEANITSNDNDVKDALYYFNGSMLEVYLDTKDNRNYTFNIPVATMNNGTYAFNSGSLSWRHLLNYAVPGMAGIITIADGTNGKRLTVDAQATRSNGTVVNIDINIDAFEF